MKAKQPNGISKLNTSSLNLAKKLYTSLPNILREIRKQLNATQEQLATELGVDVRTYRRWETGESEPTSMSAFTLGVILTNANVLIETEIEKTIN